jgi:ATP-dependent Clp protease ATP-binding subunit ClpA
MILMKSLNMIRKNLLKQKNCNFEFDEQFVEKFRQYYILNNLNNGGRGINNRVETYIKNGIANFMYEQNTSENLNFRVMVAEDDENKVKFECIGK